MLNRSFIFNLFRSIFINNIQNFSLLRVFIRPFPNLNKTKNQTNKEQNKHKLSSPSKRNSFSNIIKHSQGISYSHESTCDDPEKGKIKHWLALSKPKKIHNKSLKTCIHIPPKEEKHTWKNNNHWLKIRSSQKPNRLCRFIIGQSFNLYQRETY